MIIEFEIGHIRFTGVDSQTQTDNENENDRLFVLLMLILFAVTYHSLAFSCLSCNLLIRSTFFYDIHSNAAWLFCAQ